MWDGRDGLNDFPRCGIGGTKELNETDVIPVAMVFIDVFHGVGPPPRENRLFEIAWMRLEDHNVGAE